MLISALSDMLYILVSELINSCVCLSGLCAWIGKLSFPHPQHSLDSFQNVVALVCPVAPWIMLCTWVSYTGLGFWVYLADYQMSFTFPSRNCSVMHFGSSLYCFKIEVNLLHCHI